VWLSIWLQHGAKDVQGIDGPYVDLERLHIPKSQFLARDLAQPLALGRQFDLVESLEVAEHIPEQAAEQFVDSLVQHGRLILFSAATPGQGGDRIGVPDRVPDRLAGVVVLANMDGVDAGRLADDILKLVVALPDTTP